MLGCGYADLQVISRGRINACIIIYLRARFSAREGSTTQAESVLQSFSQAFREAFQCPNARRGNRPRLALTIPTRRIHDFHLDH